jgi:hypothetical protein
MQGVQINHQQQIQLQCEWYSYNHSGVTDTTPPTVPGTLTATNTVSSVTLDWVASTDNNLITYCLEMMYFLKLVIYLILIILAI